VLVPGLLNVAKVARDWKLQRCSSSTLLTIAIPEHSANRTEETILLQNPRGLWTVLNINSSIRFASQPEHRTHLTPLAQYVRGVNCSLTIQRRSAEAILDAIQGRVQAFKPGDPADEKLVESTVLHSTIQDSEELCSSLAATLRFARGNLEEQINVVCRDAHVSEKPGLTKWRYELGEEIDRNEDLQSQLRALSAQMRENVS
jgi:hypothetical protein